MLRPIFFAPDLSTDIASLMINAESPAAKQAVIFHDGPSTPPIDIINELVTQDHIGAVYITDLTEDTPNGGPYGGFPTQWADFLDDVEAAASG